MARFSASAPPKRGLVPARQPGRHAIALPHMRGVAADELGRQDWVRSGWPISTRRADAASPRRNPYLSGLRRQYDDLRGGEAQPRSRSGGMRAELAGNEPTPIGRDGFQPLNLRAGSRNLAYSMFAISALGRRWMPRMPSPIAAERMTLTYLSLRSGCAGDHASRQTQLRNLAAPKTSPVLHELPASESPNARMKAVTNCTPE